MIENYELAVIFKRDFDEEKSEFVPLKVVEGHLDEDENIFVDKNGNIYYHMIDLMPGNCFGFREDISIVMQENPKLSYDSIKKDLLKKLRLKRYYLAIDENKQFRVVMVDKKTKEMHFFEDQDIDEISMLMYGDDDITGEYVSLIADDLLEQFNTKPKKVTEFSSSNFKIDFSVKEMYQELKKKIIGQDEAIKDILMGIWTNYTSNNDKTPNIFVNGPTGVGKTEIFRNIAMMLNVPYVIEDANDFTMAGYIGRDVDDMLFDLIDAAEGDVEKAERGILVIDEIDKIASANSRENVSTKGVQQALLKIVEDGIFSIKKNHYSEAIKFNTKHLLVAALGAFSDIDLKQDVKVGFGNQITAKEYKDITTEDFTKFGMIPELLARFPHLVSLNSLTYEDLLKILKVSDLSVLLEKRNFLKEKNIELITKDGYEEEVAKNALKQGYGARGLNTIVTKSLNNALFDIALEPDSYDQLIVTKDTVNDSKKYILKRK